MNYFLVSLIITLIFALSKYVHIKFVLKTDVIPKEIMVDSVFVFTSSIFTVYSLDKFNFESLSGGAANLQAFVSAPDF